MMRRNSAPLRSPPSGRPGAAAATAGSAATPRTPTATAPRPPRPPATARRSHRGRPDGALKFDKTKLTAKAGKVTIEFDNPSPSRTRARGRRAETRDGHEPSPAAHRHLKPGEYSTLPGRRPRRGRMKGTLTVKLMRRATSRRGSRRWLEVAPHDQRVRDLAERPERQRVADGVAHQRAAGAVGLELVRVVPQRVGAARAARRRSARRASTRRSGQPARWGCRAAAGGTRSARRRASRSAAA